MAQEKDDQDTTCLSDKGDSDPIELNSLDFFVSAMSFFDEEANGKLSLSGQAHVY